MDKKDTDKNYAKYWYKFYREGCPACGHENAYKVRQYTEKPEDVFRRYVYTQYYDWCNG